LAAETAAREKAERALAEAQAAIRDLQTKIGHAELARNEAVEALQREREIVEQLRQDATSWEDRLKHAAGQADAAEQALSAAQEQLQEEQRARRAAEKALRTAEAAREEAEQLANSMPEEEPAPEPTVPVRRMSETAAVSPAIRRRRAAQPSAVEQEPVKWWLTTKPSAKRR
jgi:chromosome segregation ATPase